MFKVLFVCLFVLLLLHSSTVSSSINALAAVTLEDVIKPCAKMSEKHLSWASKALSEQESRMRVFSPRTMLLIVIILASSLHCWMNDYGLTMALINIAALMYGILCIVMAAVASLMGGVLQVKKTLTFVNHVICEACCAMCCFLCPGSSYYFWSHRRSTSRAVCTWYPLSICQLQSKHNFGCIPIAFLLLQH